MREEDVREEDMHLYNNSTFSVARLFINLYYQLIEV